MLRYCFLFLLLSNYNVLCISEECVTYNFEENQKVNFTNTYGICQGLSSWDAGEYSSLSIDSPHRDSTVFIKPQATLSCISSFKFSVTSSGIIELNVYMEPARHLSSEQITLLVFKSLPGANDVTVANALLSPTLPNFVAGWQTMRVKILGHGTHEGYITLLGMASPSSTVLVDSFRYIAPTYDEDSCVIYPDEKPTTEIFTTPDTFETSTTTAKPSTITVPTIHTTGTTEKTSTIIISTVPVTRTTDRPSTISIPTIPPTSTTEMPTTIPITETSTIAIPSRPVTSTTEKPSTNTYKTTTSVTTPSSTTSTTEMPTTIPITKTSTIAIPSRPVKSTTEKPSTSTYRTTRRVTTPSSTTQITSTERPRLSISILLVKIKKFFR